MTLLEKILIGLSVWVVLAFIFVGLLGRFLSHVDEDVKKSIETYRKGKR